MPLTATCHCGATKIELPHPPEHAMECNCTFCGKTGAVWGYYAPGELRVVSDVEKRTYAPSGVNQHHFCGTCGMQTWGSAPDWGSIYNTDGTPKPGVDPGTLPTAQILGINLRLLDDLDLSTLQIEKVDGRNNW
ncbi:GFA family protein [Devosia sp. RR2S18]|uniref:GFA family protein n=1 Tax=Devosia rhizosphaerae TaxID=3049774 RepID=UPI002540D1C1|nr:GFA family protein [Devosia sp. RR2S18]WIJ26255.1 GFA family protein [Devosia sp. RR2S18]